MEKYTFLTSFKYRIYSVQMDEEKNLRRACVCASIQGWTRGNKHVADGQQGSNSTLWHICPGEGRTGGQLFNTHNSCAPLKYVEVQEERLFFVPWLRSPFREELFKFKRVFSMARRTKVHVWHPNIPAFQNKCTKALQGGTPGRRRETFYKYFVKKAF